MNSISTENLPPTDKASNVIQAIGRDTVHRICSGQVVLSLAIAVKELVENAIDAGATIIDIHLREYGSDLIEVCDNGCGVQKENFKALTLKHYTSKIKQFDDLRTLGTLGFRGEALSSLCGLSDLTILTRHEGAEHATKIIYDRNGGIVSETLGAREQGTTVTLQNLFSTLPVRRKEFIKNLKREFTKMSQLLYAYCLVSKGIKFSCSNITNKGSKNIVVATEGLNTVKENIVNVFGTKQISSLIDIEITKPEEPILGEYRIELVEGEDELPFSFDFLISSVVHGNGRSASDRQFFYINSRPCEPTKVMKLVNEVYRQFNNNQYPFVYLNILSRSCLVDVNVTPDKRQIFLEKEKVLLATIKQSLIDAFKNFPSTFKMQNLDHTQNSTIKDFFENKSTKSIKRSLTDSSLTTKGSILKKFKKRSRTEESEDYQSKLQHEKTSSLKQTSLILETTKVEELKKDEVVNDVIESVKTSEIICNPKEVIVDACKSNHTILEETQTKSTNNKGETKMIVSMEDEKNISTEQHERKTEKTVSPIKSLPNCDLEDDVVLAIDTTIRDPATVKKPITLNWTINDIDHAIQKKQRNGETHAIKVRFRSKINAESNKLAEEELHKQISKEDFAKMSVIGQFNLGFIISKLQNDLFIIDQHATDEIYNFEQLQANTVMEKQILVNPKPLELTAANECLLIENIDIFEKNGFTFKVDEAAPCTKKILLTSVPLSKSIVFGKDDIDEMLFMLQDSSHTMCRPSRIRAMFASRACRKSVMIGKALSKKNMAELICHMGEINKPWNCPHGRPTMRHLINLDLIESK